DPELVRLGGSSRPPLRVNRALVETDLVIVVSAAESVLHGGPAALLAAGGADALRAARAHFSPRGRRLLVARDDGIARLASCSLARARACTTGAAARRVACPQPSRDFGR